ncbi:MAG: SGNH/GDSL hydrolase family protein [Erysipelotrichaceae bacterium]|nr:SGNH/GDSL hydrolase family protein [Erysipelotrichaceae bacterium]
MDIKKADKNMVAKKANTQEIIYYNPKENSSFKVEGLAFFNEEHKYFRLPINCKNDVSEAVYWLSSQPSGGQIRFITNSSKIAVKVKNSGDYQMCHMAATGQQGVDLYYKVKGQKKYSFFTVAKFNEPTCEYDSLIFEADNQEEKEIIINLPLYEGLEEILIGLNSDAYIKKPKKHKNKGRVIIYGTSITQGGCASRPGMSFTNILSRNLDVEFINLGFSGSGLGEANMAHIISNIDDACMYILDYDANGGATGDMKENLAPFIDILRSKHKNTPIIVISKPLFSNMVFLKNENDKRNFFKDLQRNEVEKRKENGDKNIYFIDGSSLLPLSIYDECFVDGIHPTDLGFFFIAKKLTPILRKILHNKPQ